MLAKDLRCGIAYRKLYESTQEPTLKDTRLKDKDCVRMS